MVEESIDRFPPPADDLVYLFVPHEYHPLVHELAHPTATQLRRSIAVCTEQPGTSWFETSSRLAAQAGAAVDINVLGTRELARQGVIVEHVPIGYVPLWDAWHGRDSGRSTALAFLGAYTERRAKTLAGCAKHLDGYRSAIHLVETGRPHTADAAAFIAHERKWQLLADSQVLLNVHQGRLPYMEWHRVIGAAINGCVVLSEHSTGTDPFVPGEHFVSARYEDLPIVLAGLLDDGERLERIRRAAYNLLLERMPIAATVDVLMRAVERAATAPVGRRRPPAPDPMPKALPPRAPGWEAEAEAIGGQLPIRTALKHLVVQSRKIERQLQRLQSGSERGGGVTIERLGPKRSDVVVSVLLTVYNYADYVGEALRSVALSDLDQIEVVAVDDASTDHSVEAVRAACEKHPWLSVRLLRRHRNAGLSAARNLAASQAQAEHLFILDADNAVHSTGLRLLATTMEENPEAAFAYGIIETFDTGGPAGLISWLDWDPTRLRYGNYIDAMAMIRKSALQRVGGYSTDAALSMGWEDFALWVAMADRGMPAVRIPDIVGRYRINPHSMLSLTDIDNSAVWASLLRKYPSLGRPQCAEPALNTM